MLAALPVVVVLVADPALARLGAPALAARTVVDVTEFLVAAWASLAFAQRAWRSRRAGRATSTVADTTCPALGWALFAGACGAWSLGQGVWTVYEVLLRRETPTPSLADVGFLAFAALAPAATLVLARSGLRRLSRLRAVLDGVIVTGALLLVSWMLILAGVVASDSPSRLLMGVTLAYPLGDVVVLSVVVVVASRTRLTAGLVLLTGGAGLMAVSDSAFLYLSSSGGFATGGVTDAGWTAAFVVLAAAARVGLPAGTALHTGTAQRTGTAHRTGTGSRFGLFLPYAPLLACVALLTAREVAGTADAQALAGSGVLLLCVLGRQSLLVLDNHQLVRQMHAHADELRVMAYTDPLTGIANRLGFTERLEELVATRRPLTAAFCDLDAFKAVNDLCGHAVGDALLIAVAARLTGAVREGDVVARLGGDEFAVLTAETGPDAAHLLTERLTQALAGPFALCPEVAAVMRADTDAAVLAAVSVSLGVVASSDVEGGSAEEVLHLADQRMYAAKRERAAQRAGSADPASTPALAQTIME